MITHDDEPTGRQRYQPTTASHDFSDEELARDWTLSAADLQEIGKYRRTSRLFIAVQTCAVRLYGRFLVDVNDLSSRIISYLIRQIDLPPSLAITVPDREATLIEQRKQILAYLGFSRYDPTIQAALHAWLITQAQKGALPDGLFRRAERWLLAAKVILPGPSVLERLIIHVCSDVHAHVFETVAASISPPIRAAIDDLLTPHPADQSSVFSLLKTSPPAATITSLQRFLASYQRLQDLGLETCTLPPIDPAFMEYLYRLARRSNAADIKRFKEAKRYTLMLCFLLETKKIIVDQIIEMHDQYITDLLRQGKRTYEKKHRDGRKRQKKALESVLQTVALILDWPDDQPFSKGDVWSRIPESTLRGSVADLQLFQTLEERGLGDILIARYPSLRKYFATFIQLPFAAKSGSEPFLEAITIVRELDAGLVKKIPTTLPQNVIPPALRRSLLGKDGSIQRNAWELSIAIALKDTLRSGDIYLPTSKQHVSFWNLLLDDQRWQKTRETAYDTLQKPPPAAVKSTLLAQFAQTVRTAQRHFGKDQFATINDGKLILKKDPASERPETVTKVQKLIDASMPSIRIERLLMDVDQQTNFTRHFIPIHHQHARPPGFYKTLMAALISQATNLGVVAMSASVKGVSVDMLRHVIRTFIREETLTAASAEIVNHHHRLPLSAIHGSGTMSSSDAQRFRIRADSLLASYYPRYYGYYDKAIGIYTHVSDQYAVYSTKVISCSPREALYVLDGLLENNTIVQIREHTTDTHGYTEIIFALCYLLGYAFMPRIRDLKDQQLYRADRTAAYGIFTPLLTKTVDLDIIEEQWDAMMQLAQSLKERTVAAHVVVQRLTNSFPLDRLAKAVTNLGRLIKTEYILRYITEPPVRRKVHVQLNKGEYRHKVPRWVFFANQGEFTTGDYEEIMNKASSLSLVSNAILYWNTRHISRILEQLHHNGETIDAEVLKHISLLPYKHVLPNGTYFIDEGTSEGDS